ncbi:sulfatase [Parasphingopyxis algicola]|uniref:sulfatase family protein n=1 Tax=Parasphingopyxis algicola TaxID=2026624 RepID=UPI0015A1A4C9|nr:sulfatase [Parasphingopyxis algicola]QLC24738.1 sulfatase [Parasphingopyxis algicola]
MVHWQYIRTVLVGITLFGIFLWQAPPLAAQSPERSSANPNIVLIVFEDMGPRIGAFGDPVATTPVLDEFASEAIRFPNTFTTSGVCAPSRSSLITGVHQQTLGTQHMRTHGVMGLRGGGPIEYYAVPPPAVRAFPELLRGLGYYTTNNGKTDYQFGEPFTVWDANAPEADWRGRADGQPFFAMFNILLTHESYIWPEDRESDNQLLNLVTQRNRRDLADKEHLTDPAAVEVPPYLPDTVVVRADIARHYDNIAFAERQLAEILERLEADGLLDETIVIVTTDHGDGLPRMKRSVYDSGIRVPMMIRFPDLRGAGTVDERLVSFVDLAPTILRWAGTESAEWHQGQDIFHSLVRSFIFAAADRHDASPGRSKAARDDRFHYIRNYRPDLAVLRPLTFRDALPTMQEIWRLQAAGELTPEQRRLVDAPRDREELYDVLADPHQVTNLAADPDHANTLARMRGAMNGWIARVGDWSAVPETEMIETMWPGGEQPVTAAPELVLRDGRAILLSDTYGASIAYGFGEEEPASWRIYTGPITVPAETPLWAKAIRYGFAESEAVRFDIGG